MIAYGKSKVLVKRAKSEKVLRNKAFEIPRHPKYDGHETEQALMLYKVFGKNSCESGVATEPYYQLANELHRQIIKKPKKRKVY